MIVEFLTRLLQLLAARVGSEGERREYLCWLANFGLSLSGADVALPGGAGGDVPASCGTVAIARPGAA